MAARSDQARDALVARRKATDGVSVTISRGVDAHTITAIPGRTTFTSGGDSGPLVELSTRDYLVAIADYVFAGVATKPAIGDRFSEVINGAVLTTEIMKLAPLGDEQGWRYGSQWRGWYRCHCTKVKGA